MVATQLWRGGVIWVLLRIVVSGFTAAVRAGDHPWVVSGESAVVLLVLTGVLSYLDTIRNHEQRFLANLGVPVGLALVWAVVPGALLEMTIQVLGRR
jgi:hypothetical protein